MTQQPAAHTDAAAPQPDEQAVALEAINDVWRLSVAIPMHDPETGEARTAVVSIDKRRLWQTAEGRVVRGVVVRWREGGGR
jgi:hypothetical protein